MTRAVNILLCSLFVLLWSSGWVGSKMGIGLVGPFTFLTWRYLIVVFILAALVILFGHWQALNRKQWLHHINIGLLSHGLYLGASLSAMDHGMSAGMVALVTSLQPVLTTFFAQYIIGEHSTKRQWFGIALGFTAILGTIANQLALGESVLAYLLLLMAVIGLGTATLCERASTLRCRACKQKPTPLLQMLLIHSATALGFFAICGATLEQLETQWSIELLRALLYMAVLVSIGSYACLFTVLRRMSVVKVSALSYLTQGTTMFLAWIILGETLSMTQWIGLCVVSCAVLIIQSSPPHVSNFSKLHVSLNNSAPSRSYSHKTNVT